MIVPGRGHRSRAVTAKGENFVEVSMTVNGQSQSHDVEPRTLLVQHIRENVGLTGTNIGCDTSSCGACTIHLDGQSVKSCTLLAVQAEGAEITTIEGLATRDEAGQPKRHPVQQALIEAGGTQCGFCTPGIVMSAVALLSENPQPSDDEIRQAIAGNICRCTGYEKIIRAIAAAAQAETNA